MKTAIEIGNDMIKAKVRPMTKDESKNFLMVAMMPKDLEFPADFPMPFGMQILQKRLAYHKVPVENRVLLLVTFLCDRPGTIVLYAAAIKAIAADKKEPGPVTFDEFVKAFAIGFPTEEELHRIWVNQKTEDGKYPDNWLDRSEAWA